MNFAIVLLVVVASASALNIKDSLNEEAKSLIAEGVADALMKHVSTIEEDDVSHYVEEPEIPSWLEKQVKDHVQDFLATLDPTFANDAELQDMVLAQIEDFLSKKPSPVEEADEPTARKYCAPRKAVCNTPADCCDKSSRCAYPNYGLGYYLDSEFFGKEKDLLLEAFKNKSAVYSPK
uniref:U39-Austrotoxin-Ht1z_1 n=1 Tax=Hickmania troglodytes TaxID=489260 RepID=A0A482Z6Y9_9ARAC